MSDGQRRDHRMDEHEPWTAKGGTWDESPELWELQTNPRLTAGELAAILAAVDPALPVQVAVYDGSGLGPPLDPVELGFGTDDRPTPFRSR